MKILILDDEELDLFINRKLLALEFDVEGFTSVKEATNWAQQNDFDIAVIDYYLAPGVFANHVLKELKSIKGNNFKSYVVSNYIDEKQSAELRAAGFTGIIYKPLTLEGFREKIKVH
ncbi:MAG TPA: response regulator [Chryseolinea sp.]|nr:response regulator [Chryseolinea sp.]